MVQPGNNPETRTYSDYESVNECMEGVCRIYEEHLKRRNPNTPTITYDISQLFDFVDQVGLYKCSKANRQQTHLQTKVLLPINFSWKFHSIEIDRKAYLFTLIKFNYLLKVKCLSCFIE